MVTAVAWTVHLHASFTGEKGPRIYYFHLLFYFFLMESLYGSYFAPLWFTFYLIQLFHSTSDIRTFIKLTQLIYFYRLIIVFIGMVCSWMHG